jgi:hypothetical protein
VPSMGNHDAWMDRNRGLSPIIRDVPLCYVECSLCRAEVRGGVFALISTVSIWPATPGPRADAHRAVWRRRP